MARQRLSVIVTRILLSEKQLRVIPREEMLTEKKCWLFSSYIFLSFLCFPLSHCEFLLFSFLCLFSPNHVCVMHPLLLSLHKGKVKRFKIFLIFLKWKIKKTEMGQSTGVNVPCVWGKAGRKVRVSCWRIKSCPVSELGNLGNYGIPEVKNSLF